MNALREGTSSVRMRSESETRVSSVGPIAGRVMGGMNKLMRTVSLPGTAAARCTSSNAKLHTAVYEVVHYKERKLCVAV